MFLSPRANLASAPQSTIAPPVPLQLHLLLCLALHQLLQLHLDLSLRRLPPQPQQRSLHQQVDPQHSLTLFPTQIELANFNQSRSACSSTSWLQHHPTPSTASGRTSYEHVSSSLFFLPFLLPSNVIAGIAIQCHCFRTYKLWFWKQAAMESHKKRRNVLTCMTIGEILLWKYMIDKHHRKD